MGLKTHKIHRELFATWYLDISQEVARIKKLYGEYAVITITDDGEGMQARLKIQSGDCYGDFTETFSLDSEPWELESAREHLQELGVRLKKKADTMATIRTMLSKAPEEELSAVMDFFQIDAKSREDGPSRREQMLYEMALAEVVRRKTAAR